MVDVVGQVPSTRGSLDPLERWRQRLEAARRDGVDVWSDNRVEVKVGRLLDERGEPHRAGGDGHLLLVGDNLATLSALHAAGGAVWGTADMVYLDLRTTRAIASPTPTATGGPRPGTSGSTRSRLALSRPGGCFETPVSCA